MSLLDLTILVLRFPQAVQGRQKTLSLEIDATGDVALKLPAKLENSIEAASAFSLFWRGNDQERLMSLLNKFLGDWQNPLQLFAEWNEYERRFRREFKAALSEWNATVEQFFKDPLRFFQKKIRLKDITVLEVVTRAMNSSQPLLKTQIDWKGDLSQFVTPTAVLREDFLSCHVKGVELALFIKAALRDFLVTLLKKVALIL